MTLPTRRTAAPSASETWRTAAPPLPHTSGSERASLLAECRREYERARLALDIGKPQTALTLLQRILALEPDHPEYLGLFGMAQVRAGGDLQRALDACQRATRDRPEDATLHAQLGMVYEARGDQRRARHCFEMALQLDPQHTLARHGLEGLAQRRMRFRWRSLLRLLRR